VHIKYKYKQNNSNSVNERADIISIAPKKLKGENEKMQISKKLYTTLIITLLTISAIIAAIPMASAISSPPTLYETPTTGAPTVITTAGPVGSKVTIWGTVAAGSASPFSTVTAYWDSLGGQVLGTKAADVNGEYRIDVTIPPAVAGTHYIVVNEGAGAQGAAYDVQPRIIIGTATPVLALPGDSLTLKLDGFAANSDVTLTLDSTTLATPVSITLTAPAITTNATGSQTASMVVPTTIVFADFDTYTLTAEDEDTNTATGTIVIDYYIKITPSAGPTGITATISGRIAPTKAYDITFNAAPIASGTTTADGSYSATYAIPGVLSTGSYPVQIVWDTTNTRDTTFTVNPSPTIALSATTGIAGNVVTITGSGFSARANITLYFDTTVVNSTAMNAAFGPTTSAGALPTNLKFVVPTLTPKAYAVKVVDSYGAASSVVAFTITATPVTAITLRGTTYYPGDTISFNIFTTDGFTAGPDVTIRDPTGATWWTGTWPLTASGPSWSVLYQDQLFGVDEHAMLPADAPLGSWNWTIAYTGTTMGAKTATGLFSVVALPSMQTVIDQLTEMKAQIEGVITTSTGQITALINTKSGQIMTPLNALMPKLQGIEDMGIIIATDVGEVKVALEGLDLSELSELSALLNALDVDITAIRNDVATVRTNIGTVHTAVSNLDPVIGAIAGQNAEIQTTLGTLDGKIVAVDGKVATVQTSVGTVQAAVSDVAAKPDVDMTPAWIAVVLSLIAAIAAIFAVITIRQKIAG
jgi:hypothetical protein